MGKLEWIKPVIEAPMEKFLFVLGAILVVFSFNAISYVDKFQFSPSLHPNWYIFGVGLIFISIAASLVLRSKDDHLDSTIRSIENGFRLALSPSLMIDVIRGEIQKISIDDPHAAVVLPANTSFDDECVHDKRSALGAFFQAHFPEGISQIQGAIRSEARNVTRPQEGDGYPIGATVFLDKPLGSKHRILVTAVTTFSKEDGIKADTLSLITSVKSVFKTAVGNRLSELYMPVLGTGHGGLGFSIALFLLLLQTIHCIMREGAHPIKHVVIIVHDPENRKQGQIRKVIQSVSLMMKE